MDYRWGVGTGWDWVLHSLGQRFLELTDWIVGAQAAEVVEP